MTMALRADHKIFVHCEPQLGAKFMPYRNISCFGPAGINDVCSARVVLSFDDIGIHGCRIREEVCRIHCHVTAAARVPLPKPSRRWLDIKALEMPGKPVGPDAGRNLAISANSRRTFGTRTHIPAPFTWQDED